MHKVVGHDVGPVRSTLYCWCGCRQMYAHNALRCVLAYPVAADGVELEEQVIGAIVLEGPVGVIYPARGWADVKLRGELCCKGGVGGQERGILVGGALAARCQQPTCVQWVLMIRVRCVLGGAAPCWVVAHDAGASACAPVLANSAHTTIVLYST